MAKSYNSVVKTVQAIQFSFNTLKEIYEFLKFGDVTYSIKNRILSGVITSLDGTKLNVNKNDFIVKDSDNNVSIWKADVFNKEFIEIKS